jgi:hypothetical protein
MFFCHITSKFLIYKTFITLLRAIIMGLELGWNRGVKNVFVTLTRVVLEIGNREGNGIRFKWPVTWRYFMLIGGRGTWLRIVSNGGRLYFSDKALPSCLNTRANKEEYKLTVYIAKTCSWLFLVGKVVFGRWIYILLYLQFDCYSGGAETSGLFTTELFS